MVFTLNQQRFTVTPRTSQDNFLNGRRSGSNKGPSRSRLRPSLSLQQIGKKLRSFNLDSYLPSLSNHEFVAGPKYVSPKVEKYEELEGCDAYIVLHTDERGLRDFTIQCSNRFVSGPNDMLQKDKQSLRILKKRTLYSHRFGNPSGPSSLTVVNPGLA
ncbi:hypothetical protein CPC08DRAFT_819512 [Agrocybe pediades]|nr:hypothetical protein CPC08DRAFT_819512 [Agrocybe pediades]